MCRPLIADRDVEYLRLGAIGQVVPAGPIKDPFIGMNSSTKHRGMDLMLGLAAAYPSNPVPVDPPALGVPLRCVYRDTAPCPNPIDCATLGGLVLRSAVQSAGGFVVENVVGRRRDEKHPARASGRLRSPSV